MEWLLLLLLVPLFFFAAQQTKKLERQADEAWERAAERLGGEYHAKSSRMWRPEPRQILAKVKGVDIEIDHYTVRSNNSSTTYTRITAPVDAPRGFELTVSRPHALSGLARALGFQDIELGDPEFDIAYVVKSNDVETARAWLNRKARNALQRAPDYRFELRDGVVKAERSQLERTPQPIVTAARAVAAMANGRRHLLEVWRGLAQTHGGKVRARRSGWATLEMQRDGVPLTVDTRVVGDRHYTVVRAQVVGAAPRPFALARDETLLAREEMMGEIDGLAGYGCDAPEAAAALVSERLRPAVDELRPAEIRVEGDEVTVSCRGVSTDRDELDRATALAAALASGTGLGPYR